MYVTGIIHISFLLVATQWCNIKSLIFVNRKREDYVYVKGEYQSTLQ